MGRFHLEVLETLAHEIRTPMTTIYGATKMLGRRGAVLSAAKRTEILGAVELETDRPYRLLDDFFAVAGIAGSPGSSREPVLLRVRPLRSVDRGSGRRSPDPASVIEARSFALAVTRSAPAVSRMHATAP